MTDVAEDDWITAVTPVPSRKPLTGLPVSRYRISSSLLPATCFSPSPISAMPNRNSAPQYTRRAFAVKAISSASELNRLAKACGKSIMSAQSPQE